jgi:hypothetical protein
MVAQVKRVFIGFSILWLIGCQNPSVASAGVPTSNPALTLTSLVQTLTAQPAIPVLSTNTNIVINTSTEVVITSTEVVPTFNEVIPTAGMVIVDPGHSDGSVPVSGSTPPPVEATQAANQPTLSGAPMPQPGSASIWGYVFFKDANGVLTSVPNINVTLKAGQLTKTTKANIPRGRYNYYSYSFSDVPAGPVIIEFTYSIYMTQKLTKVIVDAGQDLQAPDFYVKPIVPHKVPTPCSPVRPCGFPTLATGNSQ